MTSTFDSGLSTRKSALVGFGTQLPMYMQEPTGHMESNSATLGVLAQLPMHMQVPRTLDGTPRDCPGTPSVLDPRTLDRTPRDCPGTPSVLDPRTLDRTPRDCPGTPSVLEPGLWMGHPGIVLGSLHLSGHHGQLMAIPDSLGFRVRAAHAPWLQ